MNVVIPAIVGALASVTVAILSAHFTARNQQRSAMEAERRLLRETYLNPLRFHAVENHFRLSDTLPRLKAGNGLFSELALIDKPQDLTSRPMSWFVGEGVRLTSAAYLAACLFAHITRVRDNVPFLNLATSADTRLTELLLQVQVGFLKDRAVPYAVQTSIGNDLWLRDESRVLSFREFSELLVDPKYSIWLEPLIGFYLDLGSGRRIPQVHLLLEALEELAEFIDGHVGGGRSVASRTKTEHELRARYARLLGRTYKELPDSGTSFSA